MEQLRDERLWERRLRSVHSMVGFTVRAGTHFLTSIHRLCRELTMPAFSGTEDSVLKCGSNVLGVVQAGGRCERQSAADRNTKFPRGWGVGVVKARWSLQRTRRNH